MEEALEAIQAVIINAVWAADIEMHFNSFPAYLGSDGNRLDKGIARFCQQAALLWTASLFDKNEEGTSLKYFLDLANENSALFTKATKEEIKASVAIDCEWIDKNKSEVAELKEFRNKHIAHLDKSSVKEHSGGEIAGVTDILGPNVVEKSAKLLEKVIRIIDFYTHGYDGKAFDLDFMRGQIKVNCTEYIQFRRNQNGPV